MALIICPECGKRISDKAAACPNCGLPAEFFHSIKVEKNLVMETTSSYVPDVPQDINLQNIGNILVSFDKDYILYFTESGYTDKRPVSDVLYNDSKPDSHEAITSRDTLNILADAISDVGSWWCWHVGDDMLQLEFCDVQLYDETKAKEENIIISKQPEKNTRTSVQIRVKEAYDSINK